MFRHLCLEHHRQDSEQQTHDVSGMQYGSVLKQIHLVDTLSTPVVEAIRATLPLSVLSRCLLLTPVVRF